MHPVLASGVAPLLHELNSLTESQMQLGPAANLKRWNIQQIAEHLLLTYEQTTKNISIRLERKMPTQRESTLLQRVLRFIVLMLGLTARGLPAPESTIPKNVQPQSGEAVAERVKAALEAMDRGLRESRNQFGMLPVAYHPFFGPMRVDQWRRFHAVHARHHLKQIHQILHEHGIKIESN
jgi:hypothetical protein